MLTFFLVLIRNHQLVYKNYLYAFCIEFRELSMRTGTPTTKLPLHYMFMCVLLQHKALKVTPIVEARNCRRCNHNNENKK